MARADILAGKAFVELYLKTSQFAHGLVKAEEGLRTLGSTMSILGKIVSSTGGQVMKLGDVLIGLSVKTAIAGASITVAGIAMGTAFGGLIATFMHVGDELHDMSERTGVSAKALSELGYAARQGGASLEDLEIALKAMAKKGGSGDPVENLEALADELQAIEDPLVRADKAMDELGKSGNRLVPMLKDGSEGLQAMRMEAVLLGVSLSEKHIRVAGEIADAWQRLKDVVSATAFSFVAQIADDLKTVLRISTEIVGRFNVWVQANEQLARTIGKIIIGVTAIGAAMVAMAPVMAAAGVVTNVLGKVLKVLSAISAIYFVISLIASLFGVTFPPLLVVLAAIGAAVAVVAAAVVSLGAAFTLVGAYALGARRIITGFTATVIQSITSFLQQFPAMVAKAIGMIKGAISSVMTGIKEMASEFQLAFEAIRLFARDVFMQLPAIATYTAGLMVREFAIAFVKLQQWILKTFANIGIDLLKMFAGYASKLHRASLGMIGPGDLAAFGSAGADAAKAAMDANKAFINGLSGGKMPEFKLSPDTQAALDKLRGVFGGSDSSSANKGGSDLLRDSTAFVTYSASALASSGRGSGGPMMKMAKDIELQKEIQKKQLDKMERQARALERLEAAFRLA